MSSQYSDRAAQLEGLINACAATETANKVACFQRLVAHELKANQVTWYAAYRGAFGKKLWYSEMMEGWKVIDIIFPLGFDRDLADAKKEYYKQAKRENGVDPQVRHAVANSGTSRVMLVQDAIEDEEWQGHWQRKRLMEQGVGERMVGAFTLSPEAESYFLVDRGLEKKPFDEDDRAVLLNILLRFSRMHYWLFLERGLVAPAKKPLSPKEREIVQLLLGPKSELEMAEQLDLGKGTVHNYVSGIYKNYNVKSRYEFNQLWMQRINVI